MRYLTARYLTASLLLASVLTVATPAAAQVQIEARPDARAPEARVVPPPLHYETTRPPDADFYPSAPLVEHDPAFVTPFVGEYATAEGSGRYGLSAWTAPNTPVPPVRSVFREVAGYLAFGFSVTWDGPPAPATSPAR
jgi:hypothetical protein